MIDLGDYRDNPLRIGAYVVQRDKNATRIGLVIRRKWGEDTHPVGTPVSLQIDGRTYLGEVVQSWACMSEVSDGSVPSMQLSLEGKFQ